MSYPEIRTSSMLTFILNNTGCSIVFAFESNVAERLVNWQFWILFRGKCRRFIMSETKVFPRHLRDYDSLFWRALERGYAKLIRRYSVFWGSAKITPKNPTNELSIYLSNLILLRAIYISIIYRDLENGSNDFKEILLWEPPKGRKIDLSKSHLWEN